MMLNAVECAYKHVPLHRQRATSQAVDQKCWLTSNGSIGISNTWHSPEVLNNSGQIGSLPLFLLLTQVWPFGSALLGLGRSLAPPTR